MSSERVKPERTSYEDLINLLAHDLRTPLSTIRVGCELLANHAGATDPMAAEVISLILHSVAQVNSVVDDVLYLGCPDIAACDTGTPVHSVLTEIVDDYRPVLDLNHITLDVMLPGADTRVAMHRAGLRRVLSNLMSNAIRFTAPGGMVRVEAGLRDGAIRFEVADTGSGIPDDQLPHIFDRLWHQQRQAGTTAGLGLSLVKSIVEAHGGRICASSSVGHGSTFTVDLPAVVHQAST